MPIYLTTLTSLWLTVKVALSLENTGALWFQIFAHSLSLPIMQFIQAALRLFILTTGKGRVHRTAFIQASSCFSSIVK